VSDCVRLSRTRLQASDRTLGNFLFLGPTGVGKTELCKAMSQFIFDDKNAFTRIDMSEFGEKHTVSKLIGAPPGYVGYEEGGILTEAVRRRPYQLLLLDEFEKGHKNVWNLLLQLFDEGHLTDSHGRKVDFRNVIVVMTSNMGAEVVANLPDKYQGSEPDVQNAIMDIVGKTLSPELLNRIDEKIIFNRLQREHMSTIADIALKDVKERLYLSHDCRLDVSPLAKDCIAEKGYDVRYGARPLKRVVARDVLHPLSRLVLEGSVVEGDETVKVRTIGEAQKQKEEIDEELSWISSNSSSHNDKNTVVVLRNHSNSKMDESKSNAIEHQKGFFMEDEVHSSL